ncbi:XRE family transcriptional regulator [Salmonella enterica subsp. enterica serovar Derby]|uniref:helix-turn-helix domain-containing protein n=1 Tax=Citrobacter sp. Cf118 TaxID=2985069 RepID=UPI000F9DC94A|nr:helix-turn-helix transcriptional regulator [Citrobacter sp. Cf118]EBQ6171252.1 XRE family transcriptional regulator [Salmonella enterica subsp. enterica serovar Derby]EEW1510041.1 XRE family transcriptional regulator [Escherichia coli]ECM6877094.1 helix-turn-helix transcriptional regulator [Salmonella enterica subsp. enterica serovar Derby]EFH6011224.1 helix-turn-helix domain-containing protein [Escherichia coli]EHP1875605.1 helix-turn-helix transcriptional regulator [Escherichia coli]
MQTSTGERLKEERVRLGLSQAALGEIGGVRKQAQLNYEKGERNPDSAYLSAIAKFGADIQYIVTGIRSAESLSSDEKELINLFRQAPLAVKAAALAALNAGNAASDSINVSGSGNRVAGRDYNENNK